MGLILETRPHHLPAKTSQEEDKHRREYLKMVHDAKRKEQNDSKSRKKALQAQLKSEQQVAQSTKLWNELLPNWNKVRGTKKVQDLWWEGLPPSVRGRVWQLAIGNQLNITPQLYRVYLKEAQSLRETSETDKQQRLSPSAQLYQHETGNTKATSVELIRLDVARTFPQLGLFQKGGPYHESLHNLLGAYVCYRPDIGYIQGMSFIAGVLLLNLDVPEAFSCFTNLLNRPCLFNFFQLDQDMMRAYYATYSALLRDNLPALWEHLDAEQVTPDLYLVDWLYTLFSKSLPLDVACRIWDVYLRDGEPFLFRAAIGILHMFEEQLRAMEFINIAQFLTGLPEDLSADALFKSIQRVRTAVGRQSFADILQQHANLNLSADPTTPLS